MTDRSDVEIAESWLADSPLGVQRAALALLRKRFPIHTIEARWRVPAEIILEAIDRSPDLSQRGVRGLIAEAYFDQIASAGINGWTRDTPAGNHAFDCRLCRENQFVRVQVKSQRRRANQPMSAAAASRVLSPHKLVVETQKTRAGRGADGEDTRPYRFGEFDILAVSIEASTRDWSQFRYTVAAWLLPRPDDPSVMMKFQPVSLTPDDDWTDRLETAIEWYLSGRRKTIDL